MKILIDGAIYGAQAHGGINRVLNEVLSRLHRHLPEARVRVHLPRECRSLPPPAPGVSLMRDAGIRPWRFFRALNRRRTRLWRPQVFHSTYYTPPPCEGCRTVASVHDFIHERFPMMLGDPGFVERKRCTLESADAVVAASHATREDLLRFTNVPPERVRVIPHGVGEAFLQPPDESGVARFREAHGLTGPYWLFVGQRHHYKNFSMLLRAFQRMLGKTDGVLVAVGGSDRFEPAHVEFLTQHRLVERVRLIQGADDAALGAAYAGAVALVMPSLWEGFGIPLLEAMACGCPVVCSDVSVFREVAAQAAIYFDPYEEESIADAMFHALHSEWRRPLIQAGAARVRQFTWDSAVAELAEVYRSLA